ncbi:MAG TPA: hypothetical protein VMS31_00430, partial [Pyrinomonadaceae bacterium]|nr:hypothetical protein [Pyrinomonadaceae bacterium]
MLGQKSVASSLVRYVVVALFLVGAGIASAQSPGTSADKTETRPAANAPEAPVPATSTSASPPQAATASSELIPTTSVADHIRSEAVVMNADATPNAIPTSAPQPTPCRQISAEVVALPQPIMLNRLGAAVPDGLVFALKSDTLGSGSSIRLKDDKRPRPIVLRANVGDCLTVTFTNAIPATKFSTTTRPGASIFTTEVSLHVQGMQWSSGSKDDGSFVGTNDSSLASAPAAPAPSPSPMPGETQVYQLYAKEEGTFLLYTMGDTSSQGLQLERGLFGALNVQPKEAEWYRSQVTADDLAKATYNANSLPAGATLSAGSCLDTGTGPDPVPCTFTVSGKPAVKVFKKPDGRLETLDKHPLINYSARYSDGTPILMMLDGSKIVHSDLTAMITGPNAGRFFGTTGPNKPEPPCNANDLANSKGDPLFCSNPAAPDRKQPYREVTIIYHEAMDAVTAQAFPIFNDASMKTTLAAGKDAFAINYGTGGIAAEVYANRIGLGPMGSCVDCKFEEFFLSAWSVGDPAMLVDRPANVNIPVPAPAPPPPALPPVPPPPPLCTGAQLGD